MELNLGTQCSSSVDCQRPDPIIPMFEDGDKKRSDQKVRERNASVVSGSAARGWEERLVASWRNSNPSNPKGQSTP